MIMTGAPTTAEEDGDLSTARYSCVMCDSAQNLTLLELCSHMLTEEHRQGASVSLQTFHAARARRRTFWGLCT